MLGDIFQAKLLYTLVIGLLECVLSNIIILLTLAEWPCG
jgi:hypothetical protein